MDDVVAPLVLGGRSQHKSDWADGATVETDAADQQRTRFFDDTPLGSMFHAAWAVAALAALWFSSYPNWSPLIVLPLIVAGLCSAIWLLVATISGIEKLLGRRRGSLRWLGVGAATMVTLGLIAVDARVRWSASRSSFEHALPTGPFPELFSGQCKGIHFTPIGNHWYRWSDSH